MHSYLVQVVQWSHPAVSYLPRTLRAGEGALRPHAARVAVARKLIVMAFHTWKSCKEVSLWG